MKATPRFRLRLTLDPTRGGLLRALAETERRGYQVIEIDSRPAALGEGFAVNLVFDLSRRRVERLARSLDRLIEVRGVALESLCAPVLREEVLR